MQQIPRPLLTGLAVCLGYLFLAGCQREPAPLSDAEIDAAIATVQPVRSYYDEARKEQAIEYEASKWIATNGNFAPFGSNHFKTRQDAVAYVRKLYGMGATAVYVGGILSEPERITSEGGPYSDELYVYLPPSGPRRQALFRLEDREARAQGFVGVGEQGQDHIFLWMHN